MVQVEAAIKPRDAAQELGIKTLMGYVRNRQIAFRLAEQLRPPVFAKMSLSRSDGPTWISTVRLELASTVETILL
jgi:hypothetical protein